MRRTWLVVDTTDVKTVVTGKECYYRQSVLSFSGMMTLPLPLTTTSGRVDERGARGEEGVAAATVAPRAAAMAKLFMMFGMDSKE